MPQGVKVNRAGNKPEQEMCVRLCVHLTPEQYAWVREVGKRYALSASETIRLTLEHARSEMSNA